jgi:hypothetical protein
MSNIYYFGYPTPTTGGDFFEYAENYALSLKPKLTASVMLKQLE